MSNTPTITPTPTPPAASKQFAFSLPTIAVVGQSGTGKTYSYRNMPWDKTHLFDLEQKGFSFPVQNRVKYFDQLTTTTQLEKAIRDLLANPGPIRYVVIDSFYKYLELLINECKATYQGYDIYNNYTARLRAFLKLIKNHKIIFVLICVDEVITGTGEDATKITNFRRVFTFGREMEGKLELEFLYVFYATARKKVGAEGMDHWFITNNDGVCSAKSPAGVFKMLIPNDLAAVLVEVEKTL